GVLPVPVYELPVELLRYTLPSRFCDSDKLFDFAWKHFGEIANRHGRVQANRDWVHNNIEYRYGSGRPDLSASEAIEQRYGVCRDFAHVVVALCRTFNLPARYVSGHLPEIVSPNSRVSTPQLPRTTNSHSGGLGARYHTGT